MPVSNIVPSVVLFLSWYCWCCCSSLAGVSLSLGPWNGTRTTTTQRTLGLVRKHPSGVVSLHPFVFVHRCVLAHRSAGAAFLPKKKRLGSWQVRHAARTVMFSENLPPGNRCPHPPPSRRVAARLRIGGASVWVTACVSWPSACGCTGVCSLSLLLHGDCASFPPSGPDTRCGRPAAMPRRKWILSPVRRPLISNNTQHERPVIGS